MGARNTSAISSSTQRACRQQRSAETMPTIKDHAADQIDQRATGQIERRVAVADEEQPVKAGDDRLEKVARWVIGEQASGGGERRALNARNHVRRGDHDHDDDGEPCKAERAPREGTAREDHVDDVGHAQQGDQKADRVQVEAKTEQQAERAEGGCLGVVASGSRSCCQRAPRRTRAAKAPAPAAPPSRTAAASTPVSTVRESTIGSSVTLINASADSPARLPNKRLPSA